MKSVRVDEPKSRGVTSPRKRPRSHQKLALRLQDLPEIVGLSLTMIRGLIRTGKLPARRIGRSILVSPEDLRSFLENAEVV